MRLQYSAVLIGLVLFIFPAFSFAQTIGGSWPGELYNLHVEVEIAKTVLGVPTGEQHQAYDGCFFNEHDLWQCIEVWEEAEESQSRNIGVGSVVCTVTYFCYREVTLPDGTRYCEEYEIQDEQCEEE